MTIIEQARELLAIWDGRAEVAGVHLSFHAIATPANVAALCRALIERTEALRELVDACDAFHAAPCDDTLQSVANRLVEAEEVARRALTDDMHSNAIIPLINPSMPAENCDRDRPVVTQRMIDAGVAAYLRLDPAEDSWDRLVREIFEAMIGEAAQRSHPAPSRGEKCAELAASRERERALREMFKDGYVLALYDDHGSQVNAWHSPEEFIATIATQDSAASPTGREG